MTSDDVAACAAILVGAVASSAMTTRLLAPNHNPVPEAVIEVVHVSAPAPLVDVAIVRSPDGVEITVARAGPSTSPAPKMLKLSKQRAR